ncbi:MAG: hypothetical protein AAFX93_15205 [Verrucomicrobiota bacterium]
MKSIIKFIKQLFRRKPVFANVAVGTHAGSITRTLEDALDSRNLLVTYGSSESQIEACGTTDFPVGVVNDQGSVGDPVNVQLLSGSSTTIIMVAREPIAAGSEVYTAASGKVQNQPNSPGIAYFVGHALTATSGDNQPIEVAASTPRKTAIVAAFSGNAGTDVANLGTALEAAPDKIIALS